MKARVMVRAAECRDHFPLHELTTDITPRAVESLIVLDAVVRIISAVKATCGQRLLTLCSNIITVNIYNIL